MPWFVYIIECNDGSFYTGISNNPAARIAAHNAGKGAIYTKGRGPVLLKALFEFETRREAMKEEYRIKQLDKTRKMKLFNV